MLNEEQPIPGRPVDDAFMRGVAKGVAYTIWWCQMTGNLSDYAHANAFLSDLIKRLAPHSPELATCIVEAARERCSEPAARVKDPLRRIREILHLIHMNTSADCCVVCNHKDREHYGEDLRCGVTDGMAFECRCRGFISGQEVREAIRSGWPEKDCPGCLEARCDAHEVAHG